MGFKKAPVRFRQRERDNEQLTMNNNHYTLYIMVDYVAEIKSRITLPDLLAKLGIYPNASGMISSPCKKEKTPSCKVYENSFVDFSAGGDGKPHDLIEFYMIFYRVDFKQAVKEICNIFNIPHFSDAVHPNSDREPNPQRQAPTLPVVPASSFNQTDFLSCLSEDERYAYDEMLGKTDDEKAALREVQLSRIEANKAVFTEMYEYCLKDVNKKAWDYLTKVRELSEEALNSDKYFTINDYHKVNNHLKKVFPADQLIRSGLFNNKEGKSNLLFYSHRIVISYLSKNEIIYVRGRYFDENGNPDTDGNKYLGIKNDALGVNTPKRFYGLDVLNRMLPGEKLFLTEGEFDRTVIKFFGYNALGIPGSGNIPPFAKWKRLSSFDCIYCGDSDAAGQKMLTGHFTDAHGNKKYTDTNLTEIFKKMGKTLKKKQFPDKDINDFLKRVAA